MTASLRSELSLLSELSCLQQQGAVCDTRLVTDSGHSAAVHWPLLAKRGVWWAELARHTSCPGHAPDTVVLLQGVTQLQLQQFVEELGTTCGNNAGAGYNYSYNLQSSDLCER